MGTFSSRRLTWSRFNSSTSFYLFLESTCGLFCLKCGSLPLRLKQQPQRRQGNSSPSRAWVSLPPKNLFSDSPPGTALKRSTYVDISPHIIWPYVGLASIIEDQHAIFKVTIHGQVTVVIRYVIAHGSCSWCPVLQNPLRRRWWKSIQSLNRRSSFKEHVCNFLCFLDLKLISRNRCLDNKLSSLQSGSGGGRVIDLEIESEVLPICSQNASGSHLRHPYIWYPSPSRTPQTSNTSAV